MRILNLPLRGAGVLALLILALLRGIEGGAQARPVPVTFKATVAPTTVKPGGTATITIQATIQDGYHMYSVVPVPPPGPVATTLSVTGKGITMVGKPTESTPITLNDPNFGKVVAFHKTTATLTQKVKLGAGAPASGSLPLTVKVTYQACTDTFCLPPTAVPVVVPPLTVGRAKQARLILPAQPILLTGASDAMPTVGLGQIALGGFIAGLLALLTPCVFPLIPVTFAFFTKLAHNGGGSIVKLAGVYALGIILCFTAIGAVVAPVFGASATSRFATNPVTNLVFGVIFVLFALALLELVEFQLPDKVRRLAGRRESSQVSKSSPTLAVLAMGLTFVVSAFTCTAPFVGTILVAAAGGQWLRPIIGMVSFASALALPFFLLALFPGLLAKLPRSGEWLTTLKGAMAFVELAFSLKFLSNADLYWQLHLLTQPVLLTLWAIIGIAGAIYLAGRLKVGFSYPRGPLTVGRAIGIGAFSLATCVCVWGLSGRALPSGLVAFLPPADYGRHGAAGDSLPAGELTYISSLDAGLAQAKAENKPIFIDFTGYTCTNCRWMEKNIFVTTPVKSEMAKFVRIQLYTDGGPDGQKNQDYEEKTFGDVALPLYAVLTPDGKTIATSVGKTDDPAKFAAFLKKGVGPTQVSSLR